MKDPLDPGTLDVFPETYSHEIAPEFRVDTDYLSRMIDSSVSMDQGWLLAVDAVHVPRPDYDGDWD